MMRTVITDTGSTVDVTRDYTDWNRGGEVRRETVSYWCPRGGGYVREVTHERPGTLGEQVMDWRGPRGCTLYCESRDRLLVLIRAMVRHERRNRA